MAGLALNAGVQLGHSLAYCIANEVHVPHGVASGLALAYCIAYNAVELEHSGIGRRLATALTQGASDRLVDGAEAVQDLLGRLGMPNALVEIGITREAAARMANMCVREYPRPSNPAPLSVEPLTKLFMAMAGGDLEAAFAARSDGNG
jgi:alcohol dehydrogenase class IV